MQRLVGPRPSAVLAPAPRRALRPQRTSCVVRAGALDELEDWQRERLQQAAAAGRRQVKVERVCKELGLPRQAVLAALKELPPPDQAQLSLLQARAAAEAAAAERQAILRQSKLEARGSGGSSRGGTDRAQGKAGPAQRGGGSSSGGGGGSRTPAWKQFKRDKGLGRQAEATLEMIYARTEWPTDEAVAGLWDLHRLPREKVVEWFQQRRRQDQRRRGSGGSGGGRGSAGSAAEAEPKTDWDTEWAQE